MKCPNCLKEVNDVASFCGCCGQPIVKYAADEISVETKEIIENLAEGKQGEDEKNIEKTAAGKRKKIGFKLLLVFSVLAIVTGIVFGLFTAKGMIDLSQIFEKNNFKWTDISEAVSSETVESEEITDDKTVEKNALESE